MAAGATSSICFNNYMECCEIWLISWHSPVLWIAKTLVVNDHSSVCDQILAKLMTPSSSSGFVLCFTVAKSTSPTWPMVRLSTVSTCSTHVVLCIQCKSSTALVCLNQNCNIWQLLLLSSVISEEYLIILLVKSFYMWCFLYPSKGAGSTFEWLGIMH